MKRKKLLQKLERRQKAHDAMVNSAKHKSTHERAFTRPGSLNPRKR